MINIIKSLLSDCDYDFVDTVMIPIANGRYELTMFRGEMIENQVYLVISIKESELLNTEINENLVINVANGFRASQIYEPDMDKNTSLVYCVKEDISSVLLKKIKVEIEDDPYYFKKYVFSYSGADAEKFEQLCDQYGKSPLDFVQSYILDTGNFNKFKNNYKNESIYRMISDLVIKLPIIPISFEKQGEMQTVIEHMRSIQKCNEDEIEKLDCIIEAIKDIELAETDKLLNAIFKVWPLKDSEEDHE